MIEIFFSPTANCQRVLLAAALMELPHDLRLVDRAAGETRSEAFLAINPAGAVPVIIDHDVAPALTLAQSGAILLHLAEKSGRYLPRDGRGRAEVLQWLMQVMTDVNAAASIGFMVRNGLVPDVGPDGQGFFRARLARFLAPCETRLASEPWLAGGACSIADIALYPVIVANWAPVAIAQDYPHLAAWARRFAADETVAGLLPLPRAA